jgi:FMN reductase
MAKPVSLAGLGGSLRAASTSHSALAAAVAGAKAAGAVCELLWVRELDLPPYSAERPVPPAALQLADRVYACDAMIWSSPTYHGSVSGSFKNVLDWLILLAERDPPYLSNKPIGLVATAGGLHGLQAINSMEFIVRALRGWSVPLVQPVAQAWQSFGSDGQLADPAVGAQLRALGAEVVRAARQFHHEGTCDYADDGQFGPDGSRMSGAHVAGAGSGKHSSAPVTSSPSPLSEPM